MRKFEELIACLREASDRERREFEGRTQNLKTEIRTMKEKFCRMNADIEKLACDNGCQMAENKRLEAQLRDTECLLERMKRSAKVFDVSGTRSIKDLERDKVALASDVQWKTRKITELEREAGCLRDRIGGCGSGWRGNVGESDVPDRQWDKSGIQKETNNNTLWNRVEELELERYKKRNEIGEYQSKDCGRLGDKAKEHEGSNTSKCLWDKVIDRETASNSGGCGNAVSNSCCPPSVTDTSKNSGGSEKSSVGNKQYCCTES